MIRLQPCLLAKILIFLCLSATNATTKSSLHSTSHVSTISGEAFSPQGGAAAPDPTSVATTEAGILSPPEATTLVETETPPPPTAQPAVPAEGNAFQLPLSISFLSRSPGYRSAPLLDVSYLVKEPTWLRLQ